MRYAVESGNGQQDHSARNESSSAISLKSRRKQKATREALLRACVGAAPRLEGLEPRTLLSTLPLPNIGIRTDISGGGNNINQSSPSISYDPKNPQKLVSVYTTNNPNAGGNQKVFIGGAYSVNGGASWTTFAVPGNVINPATIGQGQTPQPFERATDANVAFDLNDNFYLVYSEHTADNAQGALVMQKFSFAGGGAPARDVSVNSPKLYQWSGDDSAWSPNLVIDNNLPTFTDPTTAVTQTDVHSGDIYVTWATQDTGPASNPSPSPFNANTVR